MLPETRQAFRFSFDKFMVSSKYQIAMIYVAVAMFLVVAYGLAPSTAINELTKVTIAYFSARVLEPIAGEIANKVNGKKGYVAEKDGD